MVESCHVDGAQNGVSVASQVLHINDVKLNSVVCLADARELGCNGCLGRPLSLTRLALELADNQQRRVVGTHGGGKS